MIEYINSKLLLITGFQFDHRLVCSRKHLSKCSGEHALKSHADSGSVDYVRKKVHLHIAKVIF